MASFLELLGQTWPARLGKSFYDAVTLPGDVYQGNVSMYGEDGHTNPEVIKRSNDLASFVTLGAGAVPAQANTLRMGMAKPTSSPSELYHVVGPEYKAGQPLRSLYARKGDAAYDEFAQRWPEAADLGQDHAHKIMFYDKLDDALSHAEAFGGKVLKVDPSKVEGLYLDTLEKSYGSPGFYATKEEVAPEALTAHEK